jgi:hypothetical protein
MTRMMLCAVVAGLTAASLSTQALADDANTARPVVTHKQMMRDCLAKERQANPGASDADMKKTCRAKVQSYEQHPSETKAPPDNPT